MPIPPLTSDGLLPPGVHFATWEEFKAAFGAPGHRGALIRGLKEALTSLKAAGCKVVYVDGSFVTSKSRPNDFDACYEEAGIDWEKLKSLDPSLLDFTKKRAAQKARFGGELFPAGTIAHSPPPLTFINFFQQARDGAPKGVIAFDLTRWPS